MGSQWPDRSPGSASDHAHMMISQFEMEAGLMIDIIEAGMKPLILHSITKQEFVSSEN